MKAFSGARALAVFIKEFQQMLRDRLTFAMAIGVPVLQLVLFGYAINTDPKGLPTAIVSADSAPQARALTAALQNTGYFRVTHLPASETEAEQLIEDGTVQFMIVIPPDFSRRVLRGERPAVLVAVDGTDPSASGNAIAALSQVAASALAKGEAASSLARRRAACSSRLAARVWSALPATRDWRAASRGAKPSSTAPGSSPSPSSCATSTQ